MTPKESLLNDFDCIVTEYTASKQETRRMLKYYAIGKWVPVSERLPEFDCRDWWKGLVMPRNGKPVWVTWYEDDDADEITHWLELDMPEVES